MFWKQKFNLSDFFIKYDQANGKPFALSKLMDTFPQGTHNYKNELLNLIDNKIKAKDTDKLDLFLALAWRDGMDESYKSILKELVLVRWHDFHEDLVDYIADFKDDTFTEDIYSIATDSFYRKYDDENDATLRKCVHALKAINSDNAISKIQLLKDTGNINIKYVLEMYK